MSQYTVTMLYTKQEETKVHKAIISTKNGNKEIYFNRSRHSEAMNVTAFFIDNSSETTYVKDENIKRIILDPNLEPSYLD